MIATALPKGARVGRTLPYPAQRPDATTVPAGDLLDGEPDAGAGEIVAMWLDERSDRPVVGHKYDRHLFLSISKMTRLAMSRATILGFAPDRAVSRGSPA
jgi:hypothetical protein